MLDSLEVSQFGVQGSDSGDFQGRNVKTLRILIVDDDSAFLDALSKVLCYLGHTVESTQDPKQALSIQSEFQAELVILDLHMPTLHDGLSAIEQFRTNYRNIQIVAISGTERSSLPHLLQTPVLLGANFYIEKPAVLDELVAVIERVA